MDNPVIYWAVMLLILIILAVLTNMGTACVATAFIMVLKYISQPNCIRDGLETGVESDAPAPTSSTKHMEPPTKDSEPPTKDSEPPTKDSEPPPPPTLPVLNPQILMDNAAALDDVLNPKLYSADDKIFDASVIAGYKDKKAKEIRSHWNNDNWKKYYDYEMGIHAEENREWWTDNEFEISKKHVVI
jgi:hypothetical protein